MVENGVSRHTTATTEPALGRIEVVLGELNNLIHDLGSTALPVSPPNGRAAEPADDLSLVTMVITTRQHRQKQFPKDWFSDPAWDILLSLYQAHLRRDEMTVGDVGHGTDNRPTTTIRWLEIIEAAGMITRRRCTIDSRRVYISLSENGVDRMQKYFEQMRSDLLRKLR